MDDYDLLHLAAIVRDSNDAILGKNLDGIITSWNGGAERIYGYTAEEAIGRTVAMLIPPDREDELPKILDNLTKGLGIDHYDTLRVTKDGRLVNIALTISPIRDICGDIIGISSIGRDITKEKEAEDALRESARAYKLLMEQASDAILVSYVDQRSLEINQRASDMLGYGREELLQIYGENAALPDGLSTLSPSPDDILGRDIVWTERPVRRKDGTLIVTELSSRRLDDGRIITIARDITDRKRTEQALRESEARYRAIVEDQTVLVSRFYPDGTLTFVNEAFCRYWDLTREELLGQSFFQYLPEGMIAQPEKFLSLFNPHNHLNTSEQLVRSPKGGVIWWQLALRALFDDQGTLLEFQQVSVDITERKLAEKALQEKELQLSEAQEIAHIGSWELDLVSGEINWSDELYRIFGVQPQSHKASTEAYISYAHVDDRDWLRKETENGFAGMLSTAFSYEHRVVRPDGTARLIFTRGKVSVDEKGKRHKVVGIVQDITEQRLAEGARTATVAAEQANRSKSEFLSRMSHELRTPLNSILGFGQLLDMDSITVQQHESVGHILKAGKHLLNLINDVLNISRIEEGKLTMSLEPVFLRDVLQESLDLVRPLAAHRSINIKADMEWMVDCHVNADRRMLQQVLLNLLANAIKYNNVGGEVEVFCKELSYIAADLNLGSTHISQPTKVETRIRIAVRDTGPGLSPENIARLFTPFERLGAEQSAVEGTGLGLALSRYLVQAMGGVIGVESEQGEGSTFWLELSATEEHMPKIETMVTGPLFETQLRTQARTILYIEDNLSNLRLIERILHRQPEITLISAMQGQMGLDMAHEHQPDLIILDLHLPDMTGNEVLRRLREDERTVTIPVIVLSADANPRLADTLLKAGAQAYLSKPIDVKQLLHVVSETPMWRE